MELNHRFLGVGQVSWPLDHGPSCSKWSHRESHPDLRLADAGVVLLDHDPMLSSGSRGTRTHKRHAAACFQDRFLIQPDDFRASSSGGWNRTNGLLVQSQASLPAATAPDHRFIEDTRRKTASSGRRIRTSSPGSKPGGLPLADPRRVPCGSRTRLAGLEDRQPLPLGQGHIKAEGEGVEPSRLIARPLSRRVPSPVGLPFRSSCGGRNRTCVVAVNSRLPVPTRAPPQSSRTAGFGPKSRGRS